MTAEPIASRIRRLFEAKDPFDRLKTIFKENFQAGRGLWTPKTKFADDAPRRVVTMKVNLCKGDSVSDRLFVEEDQNGPSFSSNDRSADCTMWISQATLSKIDAGKKESFWDAFNGVGLSKKIKENGVVGVVGDIALFAKIFTHPSLDLRPEDLDK